ncbi:HAD family hydrolase [Lacticaseibacillus brantae]|uniref:HAD superfamily hydrolase n=1 Tax=Lacticaseibacillus brantae DSM 23927 TaxID=1423727 RepID=A0A0R2B054_9LACO|nr:HAD family phosphatase [Lacticaseibacillus brantae]KRM72490.1 hypothetical protein FC34_GL000196 [Lacticaseibacillus brantae DSM 23927]
MIKAVIYDLDGTLVDSERVYLKANAQAAQQLGYAYQPNDFLPLVGVDERAYHAALSHLMAEAVIPEFTRVSQAIVETIMHKPPLMPDTRMTLRVLAQRKLSQAIVSSNHRHYVHQVLAAANISHFFTHIIAFEDVPLAKPDPAGYLKMQQILALRQDEIMVVEDSRVGVMAAQNAHIPVVQIPDLDAPNTTGAPILRRLADLPTFLNRFQ